MSEAQTKEEGGASSTANFHVDSQGNKWPIRYRASDLVNRPAPEGYVWEKRSEYQDFLHSMGNGVSFQDWPKPYSQYDYYIAVRRDAAIPLGSATHTATGKDA